MILSIYKIVKNLTFGALQAQVQMHFCLFIFIWLVWHSDVEFLLYLSDQHIEVWDVKVNTRAQRK